MNVTTIEHHRNTAAIGSDGRRMRRFACIALAVLASAGIGAVAQRDFASRHATPAITVVTPQCTAVPSGPRIETMEYHWPDRPCANRPVLVSDRA